MDGFNLPQEWILYRADSPLRLPALCCYVVLYLIVGYLYLEFRTKTHADMTSPGSIADQNTLPTLNIVCEPRNPCKNGGECHTVEEWECSGSGDSPESDAIHYRCVCKPGYTGLRCEVKLNGTVCGPSHILCTANETCTHTFAGDYKCLQPGDHGDPPRCADDTKTVKHRYNPSFPGWPIVCLEMMDTNTSWCYDPDDSLTFNITSQQVPHFLCLYVDFQKQQTCLRVNGTFVTRMVYASAWVQLSAIENDYGKVRSDTLKIKVIFNNPPRVKNRKLTVTVNTAELKTNGFRIIPAAEMAKVSDEDGVTYEIQAVLPASTLVNLTVYRETGVMTIGGNSTLGLREQKVSVIIKVNDKGVPTLSTTIEVDITLIYLDCSVPSTMFADWTKLTKNGRVAAGKMKCEGTLNYRLLFEYKVASSPADFDLDIPNGLVFVKKGNMGNYHVNITATLKPGVSVSHSVSILLSQFLTVTFAKEEKQDRIDYINEQVKSAITTLTNVFAKVLQIGHEGTIVNVLLWSENSTKLEEAKKLLQQAVTNGRMGRMIVNTTLFQSFNTVGYLSLSEPLVLTNGSSAVQNILQGSLAQIECTAEVVAPIGDVTVEWRMTTEQALVKPLPSSRIQTESELRSRKLTANLTTNPVLHRDRGRVTCTVRDEAEKEGSKHMILKVIAKPMVTLRSLTSYYVRPGGTIDLRCEVTEPEESKTKITWYKNGKLELIRPFTLESTFTATVSEETNYSCEAENDVGVGRSQTVVLNVISDDDKSCRANSDTRLTDWSLTKAGETTMKRCHEGFKGWIKRACGPSGQWEEPDYSQCIRIELVDAIDDIQWLEDGLQVNSPISILNIFVNITKSEISPKELSLITSSLNRLVIVSRESKLYEKETYMYELTKGFVEAASGAIGEKQVENWNILQKQGRDSPIKILNVLDDVGKLTAENLDAGKARAFYSKKVALQAVRTNPFNLTDVSFPGDSDFSGNFTSSVLMKKETLILVSGTSSIAFSTIYYKKVSDILPDNLMTPGNAETNSSNIDINSDVIAFNMYPHPTIELLPPLSLIFHHNDKNYDNPMCGYWNFKTMRWETDGCFRNTSASDDEKTVCSCNHLSNFALLMNAYLMVDVVTAVTIVGGVISLIFLVLTIVAYLFVRRKLIINDTALVFSLCTTLVIVIIIYIAGVDKTENKAGCTVVAVLLHYFYLVVFFVMLAQGMGMLLSIIKLFPARSTLRELLIMTWGAPLLIVVISMAATQLQGYGNEKHCWVSIDDGLLWAFVVPALAVIVVNLGIIMKVIHYLLSPQSAEQKEKKQKLRASLRRLCVLLPVIGVTWVFGVLSVKENHLAFQWISAVLNAAQGIIIFLIHCVFNRKVCKTFTKKGLHYRRKNRVPAPTSSGIELPEIRRDDLEGDYDTLDNFQEDIEGYSPLVLHHRSRDEIANEYVNQADSDPDRLYVNRGNIADVQYANTGGRSPGRNVHLEREQKETKPEQTARDSEVYYTID